MLLLRKNARLTCGSTPVSATLLAVKFAEWFRFSAPTAPLPYSHCTSPSLQTRTALPSILLISILACGGRLFSESSQSGYTHTTIPDWRATLKENVEQKGHFGGSPPGPDRIFDHLGTSSTAGSCPMTDAARSTTRAASSWHGHTSFPLASLISCGSAAPRFWIAFSAAFV